MLCLTTKCEMGASADLAKERNSSVPVSLLCLIAIQTLMFPCCISHAQPNTSMMQLPMLSLADISISITVLYMPEYYPLKDTGGRRGASRDSWPVPGCWLPGSHSLTWSLIHN